MADRIDTVIAGLQEEEETLLRRKTKLDEQGLEIDAALKRVRGALSALGVRGATKANGKRGAAKPSPDKSVVRQSVIAALQNRSLTAEDLRTEVERQLSEQGFSRMGLSLRLKEVLAQSDFTETESGYELAAPESAHVLNGQASESARAAF